MHKYSEENFDKIVDEIFEDKFIRPIFGDQTKVKKTQMRDYISPKRGLLRFDMAKRNSKNMHKLVLNLEDEDIQWLFSPVHLREIWRQAVESHKTRLLTVTETIQSIQ